VKNPAHGPIVEKRAGLTRSKTRLSASAGGGQDPDEPPRARRAALRDRRKEKKVRENLSQPKQVPPGKMEKREGRKKRDEPTGGRPLKAGKQSAAVARDEA